MRIAVCLFLPLVLSNCGTDAPPSRTVAPMAVQPKRTNGVPTNYQVQIGDTVDIFVIEDNSFNGSYPVRGSGDLIIPKLGRVQVAGMSLPQAEQVIKRALEGSQLKVATVIVDPGQRAGLAQQRPEMAIRFAGSIAKKGRVQIAQVGDVPVTAYQAIMDVGGFEAFANKKKAYILRMTSVGSQRIDVDLQAIEEGRARDVPLLDGDSLTVPQKMFGF